MAQHEFQRVAIFKVRGQAPFTDDAGRTGISKHTNVGAIGADRCCKSIGDKSARRERHYLGRPDSPPSLPPQLGSHKKCKRHTGLALADNIASLTSSRDRLQDEIQDLDTHTHSKSGREQDGLETQVHVADEYEQKKSFRGKRRNPET